MWKKLFKWLASWFVREAIEEVQERLEGKPTKKPAKQASGSNSRRLIIVLAVLSLPGATAYAQTGGCPTDTSGPPVVQNPRTIRAELPEHTANLPDGSPTVTGYTLGWYAQGAQAPTSGVAMAKSAWTLVSGTSFCYEATLPAFSGVPLGQPYVGVLKATRSSDGTESAWSSPSNPFALVGPPGSPGSVQLRKQSGG